MGEKDESHSSKSLFTAGPAWYHSGHQLPHLEEEQAGKKFSETLRSSKIVGNIEINVHIPSISVLRKRIKHLLQGDLLSHTRFKISQINRVRGLIMSQRPDTISVLKKKEKQSSKQPEVCQECHMTLSCPMAREYNKRGSDIFSGYRWWTRALVHGV